MRNKVVMRISALMVCLLILLTFTGCGSSENNNGKVKVTSTISNQTMTPPVSTAKTSQPTATAKASPTPTLKPTATQKTQLHSGIGYVNEANVNMRESASVDSAALAKLARNAKVDVVKNDAGNGWSEISYEGKNGYIASRYITMVGDADILDNEVMGVISESGVNIRTEAKTSSESLGTLTKNAEVTVVKKDAGGGWSLILYGGRLVYVASKYITLK